MDTSASSGRHAQSLVDGERDEHAGGQSKPKDAAAAHTYYTDALFFSNEVVGAITKPLDALSAFCDTVRTSDLRDLMATVIEEMRSLNEPTVESIQFLLIDELQASLDSIDEPDFTAAFNTGEHAVELITTLTDAHFAEADDLAESVAQFAPQLEAAVGNSSTRAEMYRSLLSELGSSEEGQPAACRNEKGAASAPTVGAMVAAIAHPSSRSGGGHSRVATATTVTVTTTEAVTSASGTEFLAAGIATVPASLANTRREVSQERSTEEGSATEGLWQLGWVAYDECME
jgi:hypothetical protein